MRVIFSSLILLCLLSACANPTPAVAPTATIIPAPTNPPTLSVEIPTGAWLGGITRSDGPVESLHLTFKGTSGSLMIEPRTKSWPLTVETQADASVHFTVTGNANETFEQIDFNGILSDGSLRGELKWDGEAYPIDFTAIADVSDSILEKYAGVYRFASGRSISILLSPEFNDGSLRYFADGLTLTDFSGGALRGLYPFDDQTFGVGSARVIGYPLGDRLQFVLDDHGGVDGLLWWEGTDLSQESKLFAERLHYSAEDVRFTSVDGTALAGLLTIPESQNPRPAFVMLHGSEPGRRNGFGRLLMSHYMLSQGITLLTYDKRGVGDSTGLYGESASAANLQRLAEDAIAGVDFLRSRSDIDPARIGLIGASQAGWIIPLAASQSEKVNFFVVLSGPVLSVGHEDLYSNTTNDGDSSVTYDAAKLDQTLRDKQPSGFDPLPVIAGLNQPGFWLWGGVDKSVPVTVSAENLQAMIDSGKDNFSYTIFPQGDHNLNISPNGLFAEIPYSPGITYFSALTDWLEKHVLRIKE